MFAVPVSLACFVLAKDSSFRIYTFCFQSSTNITLPQSGPYAIQLTAIDKAGNVQHARRLLFYDNSSVIETHGNAPVVINANPDTGYQWISEEVESVEVTWPGRFINENVTTGKWLNEVKSDESVSRELDDSMTISTRNTSAIDNIDGILKISYFSAGILQE